MGQGSWSTTQPIPRVTFNIHISVLFGQLRRNPKAELPLSAILAGVKISPEAYELLISPSSTWS